MCVVLYMDENHKNLKGRSKQHVDLLHCCYLQFNLLTHYTLDTEPYTISSYVDDQSKQQLLAKQQAGAGVLQQSNRQ